MWVGMGIKSTVFLLRFFQISTQRSGYSCFPKESIMPLCKEKLLEVN